MALNTVANVALRAVPGAFVLNSGISKLGMDEGTASYLQAEAAKGVPALANLEAAQFGKLLTYGEIAVGATLLLPFVPNRIAGLALGAFSAGMMSVYFRDDSKTEDDGIRPSGEGIALAKDSWLSAIAIALLTGGAKRAKKRKKK
ncbi:hypothetical protein GCM10022261_20100 [Brevibacterium daeguense]|uniref:DoxX family membrane protein n=1 Tax=Brevibacterium daeguense TaxID=909936 RepID=A0ABP8EKI5_9MICO|nr:hypothetical protein [Brevibacterium daeguense]